MYHSVNHMSVDNDYTMYSGGVYKYIFCICMSPVHMTSSMHTQRMTNYDDLMATLLFLCKLEKESYYIIIHSILYTVCILWNYTKAKVLVDRHTDRKWTKKKKKDRNTSCYFFLTYGSVKQNHHRIGTSIVRVTDREQ
jgi:hypothetical protein